MGASVRPDPVAEYLAARKQSASDPVAEYLAAIGKTERPAGGDIHEQFRSGRLQKRVARENLNDREALHEEDRERHIALVFAKRGVDVEFVDGPVDVVAAQTKAIEAEG